MPEAKKMDTANSVRKVGLLECAQKVRAAQRLIQKGEPLCVRLLDAGGKEPLRSRILKTYFAKEQFISDIQIQIEQAVGVPPRQQLLFCMGRKLSSNRLVTNQVPKGTTLNLFLKQAGEEKHVFVVSLCGTMLTLPLKSTDHVNTLKDRIAAKPPFEGTSRARQRLFFEGRELLDGKASLSKLHVGNEGLVSLDIRSDEGAEEITQRTGRQQ